MQIHLLNDFSSCYKLFMPLKIDNLSRISDIKSMKARYIP